MTSSESTDGDGGGNRPRKRPAIEICRELGFEGINDFLEYMDSLLVPYHVGEGNPDPDDFTVRAFPEFPPTAPSEANSRGNRSGLSGRDMRSYIASYELTYRHHYEMQDEWLAALADPDIACFTWPGAKPKPASLSLFFEDFELAMLCVGGDEGFWKAAPWQYHLGENRTFTTWISSWRRRLGRPVVHGVDDDPAWHELVWRDNWRAVRDEVAALNAEEYPADSDESIREGGDHEYLQRGRTMEAAVVGLADRLAREAGWPEESWELRKGRPGYWSLATLKAARQIGDLAGGPWREYIEARSGRAARLSGAWEFIYSG